MAAAETNERLIARVVATGVASRERGRPPSTGRADEAGMEPWTGKPTLPLAASNC
ncbi:MAG: hypothetical protein OZSIB_2143 [Candidatus Ozemobacter sibiricus]|uniref:Uncharacterized protein n=1 Tax=Candidatus Ozemobacter sibiricus TaxID=2268124 RepID=A0A367ZT03_9BACT|nr:MAG: hypothetical protein OZSIB_2143 [Candidatus Ozemobacter sibiricus]